MARKYIPSEAHLNAVEQMSVKNISYAKMAKALKISLTTFKLNLTLFDPYIKKGRKRVDEEAIKKAINDVEKSLMERCLGFYITEESFEEKQINKSDQKIRLERSSTKYYPPSDTAIIFYLVNHAKKLPNLTSIDWSSVNYQEKSNEIERDGLTPEESRKFMREMSSGTKED